MSDWEPKIQKENGLGLECPEGGDLYICAWSNNPFIGCCTSNPCSGGRNGCPKKNVRPVAFDSDVYNDLPPQDCETSTENWYTCAFTDPPFFGCCTESACGLGACPQDSLVPAKLSNISSNQENFFAKFYSGVSASNSSGSEIGLPSSPSSVGPLNHDRVNGWGQLSPVDLAGILAGFAIITAMLIFFIWKYVCFSKKEDQLTSILSAANSSIFASHKEKSYRPVSTKPPSDTDSNPSQHDYTGELLADVQHNWYKRPQKLRQRGYGWYLEWAWEIFLTLAPLLFIVLPILILRLDKEAASEPGRQILEVTRLGPTIYPILFAAIASRFYKSVARWRLEQAQGIRLATLEQIFGSQSFAGAFERLVFVRTQISVGVLILLVWVMSPLGGQGTSRLLSVGKGTLTSHTNIYYLHPSYQTSTYALRSLVDITTTGVNSLYSSSLLSSEKQKLSEQDPWELPKIPQWMGNETGDFYQIDKSSLRGGIAYYVSLLGVKLQGLRRPGADITLIHSFIVETSYLDFKCALVDLPDNYEYAFEQELKLADIRGFRANITNQVQIKRGQKNLTETVAPYLLFATPGYDMIDRKERKVVPVPQTVFNCSIVPILLETEVRCGPSPLTTCSAQRQRRIKNQQIENNLLNPDHMRPVALQKFISLWTSSDGFISGLSPTVNYLIRESNPFTTVAYQNVSNVDPIDFSKRLTTIFNTFWGATLNPIGHRDTPFTSIPAVGNLTRLGPTTVFFNTTQAQVFLEYESYHANRFWIALVLFTTFILELMAIIGLLLRCITYGPDILGFASSLTRENPYVPLPPGGSFLDGPERAKLLGDLRVQLADVRPGEDVGYIAVKTIPQQVVSQFTEGNVVCRPLAGNRDYM